MAGKKWCLVRFGIVIALTVALLFVPLSGSAATKYKILHNFGSGTDGAGTSGSPALDAEGRVYVESGSGGTGKCSWYGCGAVFRLTRRADGSWSEKILHNFAGGSDGADPEGGLVLDAAGNVYGSLFGDLGLATSGVFELSRGAGGWTNAVIYDNGGSCLVLDDLGNLYGCIPPGGIGELSPGSDGWVYTDLSDQTSANAPLTWDSKGNLYGTTLYGGNDPPWCPSGLGCGTAFQLAPNGDGTWTYHLLYDFAATKTDGAFPYAGLTVDASGTAYGVTWTGGKYGNGTFFKLTPTKSGLWKETILYQFPNCNDGCGPDATLVFDKAGNLYGKGPGGNGGCGGYTCGVIFKFTPQTNGKWKYSVIHKFNGADGAWPYGVVLDGKGNIFGTTMGGGKYNGGTAFEITP